MKLIITNPEQTKKRLDTFLVENSTHTKTAISNFIENGIVKVNGEEMTKGGYFLRLNDVVEMLELPISGEKEAVVENKQEIISDNVKIVFEDDDLIVVNKPKNVLVHPTKFGGEKTLVNMLWDKIKTDEFENKVRPGIVQRLDRNTSGLLVIAKNINSYNSLMSQITKKQLTRKYQAIVHGVISEQTILIKAPINRSKQKLLKMVVSDDPKSKYAETFVSVIERFKTATHIECNLATGRTHQIRVHMSYIHHPIYNDPVYGKSDGLEKGYDQVLHSCYLSFIHPVTAQKLEFTSEVDQTFQNLLKNFRQE